MENNLQQIIFTTDDGEEVAFQVLEQTRLGGIDYLLVATGEEDDEQALILKDVSKASDEEAVYEIVEDEHEIDMVAGIFTELLDDIEFNYRD